MWATAILVIGGLLLLLALAFLPYLVELVARIDEGLTAVETQLAELGVPPEVSDAVGSSGHAGRARRGGQDRAEASWPRPRRS